MVMKNTFPKWLCWLSEVVTYFNACSLVCAGGQGFKVCSRLAKLRLHPFGQVNEELQKIAELKL